MKENYLVLARKYRPASLSNLKGQDSMVTTIVNAIKLDRVAHTFLLTGIRGSGKTTTARILAKTLNCESPVINDNSIEPCGECKNCIASFANKHPDIIELDAASRTGVNDAREIIENANYLPLLGKYKIFIIDEVHMLSNSAFNALLKTLEEPPLHVKFIFATTELRKIPITILSRCQKFELKRLTTEEMCLHLQEILTKEAVEFEEDAVRLIAANSGGSARDALSLLDMVIANANSSKIIRNQVVDIIGFAQHKIIIDFFEDIVSGNTLSALGKIKEFYYAGRDLSVIFQQLLELVHVITKIKVNADLESYEYSNEELQKMQILAEKLTLSVLTTLWQMVLKAIEEIKLSSNQLIASEMMVIRLCHLSNIPSISELVENNNLQTEKKTLEFALNSNLAIGSFEELVQLFLQNREMLLYQYLINDVSLVEFDPPNIKICPLNSVPSNFLNRITTFVNEWTGQKWSIKITSEAGQESIANQEDMAKAERIKQYSQDALVKEILDYFPGATIKEIVSQ